MATPEELKKAADKVAADKAAAEAAIAKAKAQAELDKAKTLTAAGNAGDEDPDKGEKDKNKRQFSQAEVDALIKARLARTKKQYADYDELKTKAAAHDKTELSKKSAAEQSQIAITALEAERDALLLEGKEIKLRSQVLLAATELKFWSPGDAWDHLSLDDLGPDAEIEAIQKAVEAMAEAKPYLIQAETDPKKRRRTKALNPDKDQREAPVTDDERRAMYFGALGGGGTRPFFQGGGVLPTVEGKTK
ncbi:MAG: hypothetical protein KAY24_00080 [Candidatus Eisenbacteria sp.]|nr:hypothetical protein [Candidatus Eisenbacteria bacterium]